MRILLSIKPEYVEQIERHTKLFEFRKRNFKKLPSEVWIYASAPVKKIVGIIQVRDIIEDTPISLWSRCKQNAGIKEKAFFQYFKGKNMVGLVWQRVYYILRLKHDEYTI